MFKRFKKYLYVLAAILLVIFVVWAVKKQSGGGSAPGGAAAPPGAQNDASAPPDTPNDAQKNSAQNATNDATNGFKTYINAGYGFSFDYPADWSVDLFKDDSGEVAVIQNSETGILIYIYPFNEPGPISKERILRDVPDMKIANGKQIKIANTIDALSFDSDEREIGPTKEVWFVRGGFLYQISAAEGSEAALEEIINTWKFN